MQTRKLRALEVSEIGIGCMGFSHGYGAAPDREYSIQAIQMAFDHGCTFFDTAESYGTQQFYPGHNEQLVGEAIQPFRDKVILATKLHFQKESPKGHQAIEQVIRRHLEQCQRQPENVIFRRNGMSFLGGQHAVGMQP